MANISKRGRPFKIKDAIHEIAPHLPGLYRIVNRFGTYIGKSNDIGRRQREHVRSGKITEDSYFEYKIIDGRFGSKALADYERKKIMQHNPSLNKSCGGEGRPPKK